MREYCPHQLSNESPLPLVFPARARWRGPAEAHPRGASSQGFGQRLHVPLLSGTFLCCPHARNCFLLGKSLRIAGKRLKNKHHVFDSSMLLIGLAGMMRIH